ncbi:MAG: hypothetical protein ACLVG5_07365 [Clostridium sp.]
MRSLPAPGNAACQYGVLEYGDDESFSYYTRQVDMENGPADIRVQMKI